MVDITQLPGALFTLLALGIMILFHVYCYSFPEDSD